jgi:hypothetical protein
MYSSPEDASRSIELGRQHIINYCGDFPEETPVVVLKFMALHSLGAYSAAGALGPFLQVKLVPPDPVLGDQLQRSSYKPGDLQRDLSWVRSDVAVYFSNGSFSLFLGASRKIPICNK